MAVLGLLIVGITLFGALLLFGVRKNRPRRIECVTGGFICLMLLSSYGMSLNKGEVEDVAQKQFDITMDFVDCFSEGVDDYSNDYVYLAAEEMIDCAINLIDDTTPNLEKFSELTD